MISTTRSIAQRASGALLLAVVSILTSACAGGMSGLGGSSEFNCSAPPGVPCRSVTGVHINERNGTLPNQSAAPARAPKSYSSEPAGVSEGGGPSVAAAPVARHYKDKATAFTTGRSAGATVPLASQAPLSAIRSDPTVIRIWIAPWEDADGDLNDQGYVYLQIDSGRWLVEHNRERIRREFAPRTATAAVGHIPSQGAAAPAATAGERPLPAASAKGDAVSAEELAAAIARGQAMAAKRKAPAGAEDTGAGGEARP